MTITFLLTYFILSPFFVPAVSFRICAEGKSALREPLLVANFFKGASSQTRCGFSGNHQQCDRRTCQGQECAGQHQNPEPKNERLGNCAADCDCRSGIQAGGKFEAREFGGVRVKILKDAWRKRAACETTIQTETEQLHHRNSHEGDGEDPRNPSDRVVNPRRGAGTVLA
jgi:hypothetical protein